MTQGYNTKVDILSKEEQLALGTRIQAAVTAQNELATCDPNSERYDELQHVIEDGKAAATELIGANLGLVYAGAQKFKRMYPHGPEFEDMLQDGMAGLVVAAWKYDPTRGNRFTTVAHYWIRQGINRGSNKTARTVRIPENRILEYSKILGIMNDPANADLSPQEVDEKIMKNLNMSKQTLANIRQAAAQPASLNRIVRAEMGGKQELADFIPALQQTASPETQVLRNDLGEILNSAIKQLPDLQRDVIVSAFGMAGEDFTPSLVREKHGIKETKYRTVQKEAMAKLREQLDESSVSLSDFLV